MGMVAAIIALTGRCEENGVSKLHDVALEPRSPPFSRILCAPNMPAPKP